MMTMMHWLWYAKEYNDTDNDVGNDVEQQWDRVNGMKSGGK